MEMFQIESVKIKKKLNKRKIFIILIIATAIIIVAIYGAICLVNQLNNKENKTKVDSIANEQEDTIPENEKNTQELSNKEKIDQATKLTDEQINALSNIYSSKEKRVFLTFDDGPSSNTTKILEILKKNDIKATFFVLGTMVKSHPELIQKEYSEGHYIANHGYSHVYKKIYADEKNVLEEYEKTNQLIQKALNNSNYHSKVFRFPGGSTGGYYDETKSKAKKVLQQNGVSHLDWNSLTKDSDGANTKEKIIQNLKNTTKGKNSVVILMHDAPNKDLTAETLPDVINYLKEQGYVFKSLYDIF